MNLGGWFVTSSLLLTVCQCQASKDHNLNEKDFHRAWDELLNPNKILKPEKTLNLLNKLNKICNISHWNGNAPQWVMVLPEVEHLENLLSERINDYDGMEITKREKMPDVVRLRRSLDQLKRVHGQMISKAKLIRKLLELANVKTLDCSKANVVDLSEFGEWPTRPNIASFRGYHRAYHVEDCKWLSLAAEEKLPVNIVIGFSCDDLALPNRLNLGLKATFEAMRGILIEHPSRCSKEDERLITPIMEALIKGTTCSGLDCCSIDVKNLPESSYNSNLWDYSRKMGHRAEITCMLFLEKKMYRLANEKGLGSDWKDERPATDEWVTKGSVYSLTPLIESIKKFISEQVHTYFYFEAKRGEKIGAKLEKLHQIFIDPCKSLIANGGESQQATPGRDPEASKQSDLSGRVESFLNRDSCQKLQVVFEKVRSYFESEDPNAAQGFLEKRQGSTGSNLLSRLWYSTGLAGS